MGGSMSSPSLLTSSTGFASPTREVKESITMPAKSIRSTQVRHFTHAHRVKHAHLTNNVESHCRQGTMRDFRTSRSVTLRATRGTPQTDLFRSTNQFYREGVKKIMKFQLDNKSEESVFEDDSGDEQDDDDI